MSDDELPKTKKRKLPQNSASQKKLLLVDIQRYVKLLTSEAMDGLLTEDSGSEEFLSALKEFHLEWCILSRNESQDELLTWCETQIDLLLSTAESLSLPQMRTIKSLLIRANATPVASSSSSRSMATTPMSSTIVRYLEGHADVSPDSFLNEEQRSAISSANYQRNASARLSSITLQDRSGSMQLKSEKTVTDARFLLQVKLIDLEIVDEKNLKPMEYWKAATAKTDFYLRAQDKEMLSLVHLLKDRIWAKLQSEKEKSRTSATESMKNLD
jgi:hypothetical protein